MKKLFVIMLLLCMLGTALIACDSQPNTQDNNPPADSRPSGAIDETQAQAKETQAQVPQVQETQPQETQCTHQWENAVCTLCGKTDEKEKQFLAAQEAYRELLAASDTCIDMMDAVYRAWYFSIYECDDYEYPYWDNGIRAFCSSVGWGYDEGTAALDAYAEALGIADPDDMELIRFSIISSFSNSVSAVTMYYEDKGVSAEASGQIAHAKELLKSMTNEYSDYTEYLTLKDFYSEVSAYFEFCSSPTGSFSQLKTTIDNYETNIRKYKNDLSFVFED